jgi:hypothetical protein
VGTSKSLSLVCLALCLTIVVIKSPLQREDVLEDFLGVSMTTSFPFQISIYRNYHVYLVMVFHFQVNDMTHKEGRVGISSMQL